LIGIIWHKTVKYDIYDYVDLFWHLQYVWFKRH
jgi:hypothetical protein